MPDETLPQRTLKTTFYLGSFFTLVFVLRGDTTIALGLALGVALGLFSLWSLTFAIPRLFTHTNPAAKFWLGLITFAKLPIYAGTLYVAMVSPYISPIAVFMGVASVPAVVVLKVLGFQMTKETTAASGDEPCRTKPSLSNN